MYFCVFQVGLNVMRTPVNMDGRSTRPMFSKVGIAALIAKRHVAKIWVHVLGFKCVMGFKHQPHEGYLYAHGTLPSIREPRTVRTVTTEELKNPG